MLHLNNLWVSLHGKPILAGCEAKAKTGDLIIVTGANGTGKSTLFRSISGKQPLDRGRVLLGELEISKLSQEERAFHIAELLQNPYGGCAPSMTVAENFALFASKNRRAQLKRAAPTAAELQLHDKAEALNFDLAANWKTPMRNLSGGQCQVIAFLLATLGKPKLLLLDEPTAALDPKMAEYFLNFVRDYVKIHELTTLMITHDERVRTFGDEQWVLQDGTLLKLARKKPSQPCIDGSS
jgi:putative ABC transport system ATP-binding protein